MIGRAIGIATAMCLAAGIAAAQDIPKTQLKVVGTWNFLTNWQKLEQPFWKETLSKASGGQLTADLKSYSEINMKGTEVMRLLKLGVFDVVAALPIYIDEGAAVVEGIDISGVAKDFATSRKISEVWRPFMADSMKKQHNAHVLGMFPFPQQVFYCRTPIKSIEDLKGKKIRVQGTSQGDFAEAVGGSATTIAFGEVVPALEKGVVDCGITGTMPGYKAKWYEVTNTMYTLSVGYTLGFWAINQNAWGKLNDKTKALITEEMKKLEELSWKTIEAESDEGIACNTGTAACSVGAAGKLALVKPSESDIKTRDRLLNEVVLKRWAKRCGAECTAKWNDTVGKITGLAAKE